MDINKKIWVKNTVNWDLYFNRLEGIGDVHFVPNGKLLLQFSEIQSQVFNNNKMFSGEDGKGNHARLFVDDKDARVELMFETADEKEKQFILTDEKIKEIINIKTQKAFEKEIEQSLISDAEKKTFAEKAYSLGLTDVKRIKFIEEYTENKVLVSE